MQKSDKIYYSDDLAGFYNQGIHINEHEPNEVRRAWKNGVPCDGFVHVSFRKSVTLSVGNLISRRFGSFSETGSNVS